jgi:nitronate monooxygenase
VILDRLERPVVLAPLAGGPSTPELAAAVSDAGGLGFLAIGYLTAAQAAQRLAVARRLTSGALGVNVFVPGAPAHPSAYRAYVEHLQTWAGANGEALGEPQYDDDDWEAKIELLISEAPEVVSFTFGSPPPEVARRLSHAGTEIWVTVTSPDEARQAVQDGADVVVAQGVEAGGHRGSFQIGGRMPLIGLLALVDLVRAAVPVPVVASGGIATGRALAATVSAGARAGQVGTAFMLAPEAGTSGAHRDAIAQPGETVLTRAFTGRLARGIRNRFIDEHEHLAADAYPEIHHVTGPMRRRARERGDAERINLWAGQAHELSEARPAAETVSALSAAASAS